MMIGVRERGNEKERRKRKRERERTQRCGYEGVQRTRVVLLALWLARRLNGGPDRIEAEPQARTFFMFSTYTSSLLYNTKHTHTQTHSISLTHNSLLSLLFVLGISRVLVRAPTRENRGTEKEREAKRLKEKQSRQYMREVAELGPQRVESGMPYGP